MNRTILKTRVGEDGILHLEFPLGINEARREVQVTIEAAESASPVNANQWPAFVDSLAGSWQGEFTRPSQGVLEEREMMQ
jgi:hypothetical protein